MKVISIDGHPREEELVAYVSDTLEADAVERLEDHVFDCEVCAVRLQRAAHLQMLLHEAAQDMAAEPAPAPAEPARRRWRVGALGGVWAAAAAMVLMVCQQSGSVAIDPGSINETSRVARTAEVMAHGGASFIDGDPSVSDGLLASLEPLESIDPLQTWPDDRSLASDEPLDGEPCGSGEDGGTLVCQLSSG